MAGIGSIRLVSSLLALVALVAACSDPDDGLELVTNDEQRQVQVGGDDEQPEIGDGGAGTVLTDGNADPDGGSGADGPVDPSAPDPTGANPDADSDATADAGAPRALAGAATDDADADSGGGSADGGEGADADSGGGSAGGGGGGGEGGQAPPPPGDVDEAIEDADPPLGADPATADRADVAYPTSPVVDLGSGGEIPLASVLADRANRTLLWFWAPDAAESTAEAATVQRLSVERADNVDVIAVASGGDRATAQRFVADSGLATTAIVWDAGTDAAEHYGIEQLPTSILLDRNGDVIARWTTLSPEVFDFLAILP